MPSLSMGRLAVDMDTPRHSSHSLHFRKAEVLYLLSRGAQMEHPHMINVHYAAYQPGPTLADVKDRLIALRGKAMPDSFSWSYKRHYKDTFIWCDLFDDDLIVPLAESGEYILKAVEILDLQDASDEEIEFHSARESLSLRGTPRLNGLGKASRHGDRTRKESLSLNGDDGDMASDHSTEFSKYDEDEKYIPERQEPRSVTDRILALKRSTLSPRSAYLEMDCTDMATPAAARKENLVSVDVFSPSPHFTPGSGPARRRTWEREIDKVTIYTDFSYKKGSDNEHAGARLEEPAGRDRAPTSEDSFLYMLRKATRLGSFKGTRLCKGVDVLDSTRIMSSKMHKAKDEVNKLLFKTPAKQAHISSIDEPPRKSFDPSRNNASVTSFAELVRLKNQIKLSGKSPATAPENKYKSSFADKPVKEFRTLAEYFDSKERNVAVVKPIGEPGDAQPEYPQQVTRSSGNVVLDVTYGKTMDVLPQLSISRLGTHPEDEADASPVTQGEAKKMRSESEGNKQDVIVETGSPELTKPSPESSPVNMSFEEKRSVVKEPIASSENPSDSHRAEAVSNEERIETQRPSINRFPVEKLDLASLVQRPRSGTLHSGNKQEVKTANQVSSNAEAQFSPKREGAQGCLVEQPTRPKDFKSREDRPLTCMDWEKSFQEAAMHSEPPADLVLHECLQCGRTFKLDSLQVHMRGCHAVKKPKSLTSTQRKRLSI